MVDSMKFSLLAALIIQFVDVNDSNSVDYCPELYNRHACDVLCKAVYFYDCGNAMKRTGTNVHCHCQKEDLCRQLSMTVSWNCILREAQILDETTNQCGRNLLSNQCLATCENRLTQSVAAGYYEEIEDKKIIKFCACFSESIQPDPIEGMFESLCKMHTPIVEIERKCIDSCGEKNHSGHFSLKAFACHCYDKCKASHLICYDPNIFSHSN